MNKKTDEYIDILNNLKNANKSIYTYANLLDSKRFLISPS